MRTFQISVPDDTYKKIQEMKSGFTTRNGAILHLIEVALECRKK